MRLQRWGFAGAAVGAGTLPNAIPVALEDGKLGSRNILEKRQKISVGYLKGDMVILQPGRRDSKSLQDSHPLWIIFTDTNSINAIKRSILIFKM